VFGSWEINNEVKIVDSVFKVGMDAHPIVAQAKKSQKSTKKKWNTLWAIGGVSSPI
jgi:hypothetical protein